jgi:hypothetical protein
VALPLFLDHPSAFKFAWARYWLRAPGAKLSVYAVPSTQPRLIEEHSHFFHALLQSYLEDTAQGQQCQVRWSRQNGEIVIVVKRE